MRRQRRAPAPQAELPFRFHLLPATTRRVLCPCACRRGGLCHRQFTAALGVCALIHFSLLKWHVTHLLSSTNLSAKPHDVKIGLVMLLPEGIKRPEGLPVLQPGVNRRKSRLSNDLLELFHRNLRRLVLHVNMFLRNLRLTSRTPGIA